MDISGGAITSSIPTIDCISGEKIAAVPTSNCHVSENNKEQTSPSTPTEFESESLLTNLGIPNNNNNNNNSNINNNNNNVNNNNNNSNNNNATTLHSHHIIHNTCANVIVEPMPYTLSEMDTVLDIERDFTNLINMPDPELIEDGFFDYTSW